MRVPDHVYSDRERFGYGHHRDKQSLTSAYLNLLEQQVKPLISKGLCAAIYTQTTDIETEINGFMTYDRKVEKMDAEILRLAHLDLINTL